MTPIEKLTEQVKRETAALQKKRESLKWMDAKARKQADQALVAHFRKHAPRIARSAKRLQQDYDLLSQLLDEAKQDFEAKARQYTGSSLGIMCSGRDDVVAAAEILPHIDAVRSWAYRRADKETKRAEAMECKPRAAWAKA